MSGNKSSLPVWKAVLLSHPPFAFDYTDITLKPKIPSNLNTDQNKPFIDLCSTTLSSKKLKMKLKNKRKSINSTDTKTKTSLNVQSQENLKQSLNITETTKTENIKNDLKTENAVLATKIIEPKILSKSRDFAKNPKNIFFDKFKAKNLKSLKTHKIPKIQKNSKKSKDIFINQNKNPNNFLQNLEKSLIESSAKKSFPKQTDSSKTLNAKTQKQKNTKNTKNTKNRKKSEILAIPTDLLKIDWYPGSDNRAPKHFRTSFVHKLYSVCSGYFPDKTPVKKKADIVLLVEKGVFRKSNSPMSYKTLCISTLIEIRQRKSVEWLIRKPENNISEDKKQQTQKVSPKTTIKKVTDKKRNEEETAHNKTSLSLSEEEMIKFNFPSKHFLDWQAGWVQTEGNEKQRGEIVAICLGKGSGLESLCLVNEKCEVLLRLCVAKSGEKRTDLNTVYLERLEQVQRRLMETISKETLLVGFGLDKDLRTLRLYHSKVIDTSIMDRRNKHGTLGSDLESLGEHDFGPMEICERKAKLMMKYVLDVLERSF